MFIILIIVLMVVLVRMGITPIGGVGKEEEEEEYPVKKAGGSDASDGMRTCSSSGHSKECQGRLRRSLDKEGEMSTGDRKKDNDTGDREDN